MELPEGFSDRMRGLLGEEYEAFVKSYERERMQGLRLNGCKGERESFYREYQERFGLRRIPWCPDGFYYDKDKKPGKSPLHEAGVYYIQEPSAMTAAELLHPGPGERVLDLCAAPGGKTTQIGEKLGKHGLLISNEIHPDRAKILSRNVERMGLVNTVVVNEEPEKLAKVFPGFFDKVLVDAPCSGEGMFRKEEQARLQWSMENVELCAARQREILEWAALALRPGGQMAYSTCTFSPEENERQIEDFLERHPEFLVVYGGEESRLSGLSAGRAEWSRTGRADIKNTFRVWPHKGRGEGHFVALLEKQKAVKDNPIAERAAQETAEGSRRNVRRKSEKEGCKKDKKTTGLRKDKEGQKLLHEFLVSLFREEYTKEGEESPTCRLSLKELEHNLVTMGDQVYRLPEGTPELDGIKVLRAGLHLGTLKKNRFEPSHALALSLAPEQVKRSIRLEPDQNQVWEYLAGQTLETDQEEKGWVLVCVREYSLGWGKAAGRVIKNHYPKGLRIVRESTL